MSGRRLTLTPNASGTAVLIASGDSLRIPVSAFISRGDAAAAIQAEADRSRASTLRQIRQLGLFAAATVALPGALLLLPRFGFLMPAVVFGVFVFLLLQAVAQRVLVETGEERVRQVLAGPGVLIPCSVDLALHLTPAQYKALRVADAYGLAPEILESLQECREARRAQSRAKDAEDETSARAMREAEALAIVDEHRTA